MPRPLKPFSNQHATLAGVMVLALVCGCQGAHVQGGPTIGFAFKRGTTVGWEAGAGSLGLVRLNVGGTYRLEPPPAPEETDTRTAPPAATGHAATTATPHPRQTLEPSPDAIHYLALEPLGVSLGITLPDVGSPGFLGGVWAGWIFDPNPDGVFGRDVVGDDRFTPNVDCPDSERLERGLLLSGALGLRYMGGEWEAYFTPKAVLAYCLELGS